VSIGKEITNNLFAVSAWERYALLEIEAIIQRSVGTLDNGCEVEMVVAIYSQRF
jgi:hypothetical protein